MHVLGPFDRYPLADNRSYTCPPSTVEDYEALKAALGIDRCVIVHGSANGVRLDVTVDALRRWGDRARGVAVVLPDVTDRELHDMHEAGFRAVRLTTFLRGGMTFDHIESIAARIAPLGWHIQVFTSNIGEMAEIAPRLARLPTDVVVDHMGHALPRDGLDHPGFRALLDLVRAGRCWVKLSSAYRFSAEPAPWTDCTPFAKALLAVRPDRMLWATDWPHVMVWDYPMPDDAAILDWVLDWGVDEATLRMILVDNPRRLFWGG
jgi:predicted TIM-barrel fold metal-dependent hydrolase